MEMLSSNINCRVSSRAVKPSSFLDGGVGFCRCFYCELADPQSRMIIDDNHNSQKCMCRKVLLASVCYNRSHYCLNCSRCGCFACAMTSNSVERTMFYIGELISKCTRCDRVDITQTCFSSGRKFCVDCQFVKEESDNPLLETQAAVALILESNNNLFEVGNSFNNYADIVAAEEHPQEPFIGVVDVIDENDVVEDVHRQQGNIPLPSSKRRRTEEQKVTKTRKSNSSGKNTSNLQSTSPSHLVSTVFSCNGGGVLLRQSPPTPMPGPSNDSNAPCSSGVITSENTQRNVSSLTQTNSIGNSSTTQRSSSLGNSSAHNGDSEINSTTDEKKSIVWRVCVLDKSRPDDVKIKCVCGWSIKYLIFSPGVSQHISKCNQARRYITNNSDGDGGGEGMMRTFTASPGQFGTGAGTLLTLLSFLPDGTLSAKHRTRDYANVNLKRGRLAEMVLLNKQPFKLVEHVGFRRFVECLAPQWSVPARRTIANDIQLTVFPEVKRCIKEGLFVDTDSNTAYSLTTDIWCDEHSKNNFVSLTAHWITCSVELRYCTIGFEPISTPHSGRNIASILYRVLRDFGLDKSILSITLDDASNNTTCLTSLRQLGFQFLFDGKYSHTRCNGHIINLIAKDGLQKLKSEISALRWYVKLFNSSSAKREEFNKHVQDMINPTKKLAQRCLDIHTRWNATHDMIGSCLPYAAVFDEMSGKAIHKVAEVDPVTRESSSTHQVTPTITQQGWSNLQKLYKVLHPMKEATKLLSARKTPTLHNVMYYIQAIKKTINRAGDIVGTDAQFTSAADSMARKLNKYYEHLDPQLVIAHVLDPRAKLLYLRRVHLSSLYNDQQSIDQHMTQYYANVKEAFQCYSINSEDQSVSSTDNQIAVPERSTSTTLDYTSVFKLQFELLNDSIDDVNELDTYLSEPAVKHSDNFDVLQWWKLHSQRFPTLFRMAKQFFGICASSVPSESLFFISGQVLNEHRASMGDERQHICVAAQQWLEALIRYNNSWPQPHYEFQGQYKKASSLPAQDREGHRDSKAQDEL